MSHMIDMTHRSRQRIIVINFYTLVAGLEVVAGLLPVLWIWSVEIFMRQVGQVVPEVSQVVGVLVGYPELVVLTATDHVVPKKVLGVPGLVLGVPDFVLGVPGLDLGGSVAQW